jgi:hypothetical protein
VAPVLPHRELASTQHSGLVKMVRYEGRKWLLGSRPGLRAVAGGLAQLTSTADATCNPNRPLPANHSLAKGECRRPSQSKSASPDVAGKHVVGGMISNENARGILPRRTAAPISLQRLYLYSSGAPPQTNRQREFRAIACLGRRRDPSLNRRVASPWGR